MKYEIDMTGNEHTSILHMLIFMGIGQLLMILGHFLDGYHGAIMLFSILDLDQYILMMVHVLSVFSFVITILVGIPKAVKEIKGWKRLKYFNRKKRKP